MPNFRIENSLNEAHGCLETLVGGGLGARVAGEHRVSFGFGATGDARCVEVVVIKYLRVFRVD